MKKNSSLFDYYDTKETRQRYGRTSYGGVKTDATKGKRARQDFSRQFNQWVYRERLRTKGMKSASTA